MSTKLNILAWGSQWDRNHSKLYTITTAVLIPYPSQISELQSQLSTAVGERETTESSLTHARSTVERLTVEIEECQERATVLGDSLDQANSDTEAWTVRTQILSLELAGNIPRKTQASDNMAE